MNHSERLEIFDKVRADYEKFLTAILWKLTGDRELFTEAMQNALLIMWKNVEKLEGENAGGYIYKIALSANSKAWRNRIGKNGDLPEYEIRDNKETDGNIDHEHLAIKLRKAISQLSERQSSAIVLRYFEQKDYDTIAGKLKCTNAGARSHVSKAIANLKNKLSHLYEVEVEK
ncbi:MAG: sigma-70 family RNA polymerase sigma factor [Sedimentisphaerales bacterium]|nr:sigma-70 family RNA polymerase sigma factor [Sedimentisphaerales bacterium]